MIDEDDEVHLHTILSNFIINILRHHKLYILNFVFQCTFTLVMLVLSQVELEQEPEAYQHDFVQFQYESIFRRSWVGADRCRQAGADGWEGAEGAWATVPSSSYPRKDPTYTTRLAFTATDMQKTLLAFGDN